MCVVEESHLTEIVDLARARRERLEAEELRLLGAAVGEHLPLELCLRVEQLRCERRALASPGELPPAA